MKSLQATKLQYKGIKSNLVNENIVIWDWSQFDTNKFYSSCWLTVEYNISPPCVGISCNDQLKRTVNFIMTYGVKSDLMTAYKPNHKWTGHQDRGYNWIQLVVQMQSN